MTLNFNNKMSTAAVFLDTEKAFDTTWHPGLFCKLSNLTFLTHLIKLISSCLLQRKFCVLVEGKMSTPRYMQAGVPQGSILSPTLYNLYINDTPPQTYGVNLTLSADDTCLYATEHNEGFVLRKIQCGVNSMAAWCERWNIKINEDKTRVTYFSHQQRPPNSLLTLNGQNIQFVNSVKHLGIIFDKRMTRRLYLETIEAKAFRVFFRLYSVFKSEQLSAHIKLTLH
jgi:hypothetical protein